MSAKATFLDGTQLRREFGFWPVFTRIFNLAAPVRRNTRPPLPQHRFVMRAPRVTNHAYQGKPRARMKSAIASPRISCMGRRS